MIYLIRSKFAICLLIFIGTINSVIQAQTATLEKGVDLSQATSGQQILYTLTYGCSSLDADCIGAVLVDNLPAEVEFTDATIAIIEGSAGTVPIIPVYDPINHSVTWDFTQIQPEGGLPDGASGVVDILVTIPAGQTPNGLSINNTGVLTTDNAGSPTDDVNVIVEGVEPQYTITKSLTNGPIYHDRDITYEISVCSDTDMGNLDLLPGATIEDVLPPGAIFIAASGNGIHDGGTPGMVTWTIPDTFHVDDSCQLFSVIVQYPSSGTDNQTGLNTEIPKENTANLEATAFGDIPVLESVTTTDPLLPPSFASGIVKTTAMPNNATIVGFTNKFIIGVTNESTVAVDHFVVTDTIPAQVDVLSIHIEETLVPSQTADIRVQIDGNPTWIVFQTAVSTAMENEFDVTTIPGWMAGSSYLSIVEVDYGTVPPDFMANIELIYEPSHPTANDGTPTNLDTSYSNSATLVYTRPQDGIVFTTDASTDFCIVNDGSAQINPTNSVEINYVDTPAGATTTSNPYFKGARVKYTVHLENQGGVGMDIDSEITTDTSLAILNNPIGSNLLPAELDYENGSWTIINNNSGEVWDNTSGNPAFEFIPDFNNTGKTLLRWTFTGDLEMGESLDICFNAFIKTDVEADTEVINQFAMTSESDLYCADDVCESVGANPDLNNYFGQSANPSTVITGITELCDALTSFIVVDTTAAPVPSKTVLSPGPYAPSGSSPVELGLSSDIVSYGIEVCNDLSANYVMPDAIIMDLLPEGLSYIDGSIALANNTSGLTLDSDLNQTTNPTLTIIDDFSGSGRQLLRWNFTGDMPIDACIGYSFDVLIEPGTGGLKSNEPLATTNGVDFTCINGSLADDLDLDNDGITLGDQICTSSQPADILIPQISSFGAQKFVQGSNDSEYLASELGVLAIGDSDHSEFVNWRIRAFNPGNETLTDAVIVDIFPHVNDFGVQLTNVERESEWSPILMAPITSPSSTIDIYYSQSYNPCRPEINPLDESGCIDDWSTSPPIDIATVKAIKIDFANEDLEPAEEFFIDFQMSIPDSVDISPGIAWNSIARNANEVPAQEPNKVGVAIRGYDLALRKELAPGQNEYVSPGDDVTFRITVVNQSTDSVQNVTVTDYLPSLLVLNDSDWTVATGNSATILIPTEIAPNDSLFVDITATVATTAETGDLLDNFSEISDFEDMLGGHPVDWDSTNDNNATNDFGGEIGSNADNVTYGNGQGTTPGGGDAATDEDDHDGVRLIVCPSFTMNIASNQAVCTSNLDALEDIVIPTNADNNQNIQFVLFNTEQSGTDMYSSGVDLFTTTPSTGNATLPEANIPTTEGTFYIYSILSPTPADPNCRPFDVVRVIINPTLVASAGSDEEICDGESITLSASATGGNGNYNYLWSTGATSSSITVSPNATTTYTVSITDSSGNCTDSDMVEVTVNPLPTVSAGADINTCINQAETLTATGANGTPGYNYAWSSGDLTASSTVMVENPTTYTVTVTDSKGCQATDDVQVIVPVADAGQDEDICEFESTTLMASGGVSYEWSTGDMTSTTTVNPLTATTYYVTVTDNLGCTDVDSIVVNVNTLPTFTANDGYICAGDDIDLTSLVNNYANINTPMWFESSVDGTAVATPTAVSPSNTSNYAFVGTDNNGCRDTVTVEIEVNLLPTICLPIGIQINKAGD